MVLSPGPGKPCDSGNLLELIECYMDKIPILGICLGHQAIGNFMGAQIIKAEKPMHGKISKINLTEDYLFRTIPKRIKVVRYHSLVLYQLPEELEQIATTSNGEIMAIRHKHKNIRGLQFHPEAVMTEFGKDILWNWVEHNEI
jgi:anthranilate synthase component 2